MSSESQIDPATIQSITETIHQSVQRLPFLMDFINTCGAWIFGGFNRFHVETWFQQGRGPTQAELFKYLSTADVDISIRRRCDTKCYRMPFLRMIKKLSANGILIDDRNVDYMPLSEESAFILDKDKAKDIAINDDYVHLHNGVYVFWIPLTPEITTRYEVIFHNYAFPLRNELHDFTPNTLDFKIIQSNDSDLASKLILESTNRHYNAFNHIKTRQFEYVMYNGEDSDKLKSLYRTIKLWKNGYRPKDKQKFAQQFVDIVTKNRSKKSRPVYIMTQKFTPIPRDPNSPPVIKYNIEGFIELTLDYFLKDQTINEIMRYLRVFQYANLPIE